MKVKFYTVLALLFVCAKSFGGITTKIISPVANSTNPTHIRVYIDVKSTYDIQSVKVNIAGADFTLPYSALYLGFVSVIDLSAFADGTLHLKATVTDVFNTVDTASVNFTYIKSYTGFTNHIKLPAVNSTNPNHMYVSATSSYINDLASSRLVVSGISSTIPMAGGGGSVLLYGAVNLTGLPDTTLTIRLFTTDGLGNVDSSATSTFKHKSSFKPLKSVIISPQANYLTTTGTVSISVKMKNLSAYSAQACDAKVGSTRIALKYAYVNDSVNYTGTIDVSSLPGGPAKLFIYTYDNRGNIDTNNVDIFYHKKATLQVIKNWPNALPVVRQPFLHIKAVAVSYNTNCTIKVYNAKDNKLLTTAGNVLDTIIDVTGIAYSGAGSVDYGIYNRLKIYVTDSLGFSDGTDNYYYIYEPSPYLKAIDSIPKARVSLVENVTSTIDSCWSYDPDTGDPRQTVCVKVPDSYSFTITTPSITFTRPAYYNANRQGEVFKEALAYNDNYVVWQDDSFIHRFNLNTLAADSVAGIFAAKASQIALDSNGNFATSYNDTIYRFSSNTMQVVATGAQPKLAIDGSNIGYFKGTSLYVNDGTADMLVDTGVIAIDNNYSVDYIKMANGLIAYYKKGNVGQRAVWLADAGLNKSRVTFSYADAYLEELNSDGSIIYGQKALGDGLATFYTDRFGNSKQLASCGSYYNQDSERYIFMRAGGSFIINLNPGVDSLAPIHREVKKDSAVAFAKTDFDNAYTGPGHVFKVKITGLPKFGTLYINKVPITLDSVVNHASLGGLSYKPNPGYSGKDTIRFTVWNGAEFVANDTIIELSVVTTLPVQLLNFSGKALGKANQLRWQTAQEINSSYFGVEKSTDGVHFTAMGNVTARGNSSITENYEYLDAAPQTGLNYYRLKIADKDASYSYSQTISIRNTGSYITLAYPNPAKSFVNLSFTAARSGRYSFTVYSSNGKAVSTNRYAVNTGNQNISLPLTGVAGTYIIKVTDAEGNSVTEQKVVNQ